MLTNILLVIHLLVAVAIVILVLLQQGKGSDMGAAFGGGSSQSLFGARGSANFLSRATSFLVTFFFLSSLTLAYIYTHRGDGSSIIPDSADSFSVESTLPDSAVPDLPDAPAQPDGGEATQTDVPTTPE